MSNDPAINSALLRLCATSQQEPSRQIGAITTAPRQLCNTESSSPPAPAVESCIPQGRQVGDYDWLRNALASVESPERQVKRLLETIEKTNINKDDMLEALDALNELVEDLNWATEFTLMQGPERVIKLLICVCKLYSIDSQSKNESSCSVELCNVEDKNAITSSEHSERNVVNETGESNRVACATNTESVLQHEDSNNELSTNLVVNSVEVRVSLVMVIAHASQLHKPVQDAFAYVHWEQVLLPILREEKVAFVSAAVVFAISALCRQHEQNTLTFVREGGLLVLTDVINRPASMHSAGLLVRTFQLISFFAECGISTESAIRAICEYVECRVSEITNSDDIERVRQAAAHALSTLLCKSPSTVKDAILRFMPTQIHVWMSYCQQLNAHECVQENNTNYTPYTCNQSEEDHNNNNCVMLARQMFKI